MNKKIAMPLIVVAPSIPATVMAQGFYGTAMLEQATKHQAQSRLEIT
jgi:hypothetical protein